MRPCWYRVDLKPMTSGFLGSENLGGTQGSHGKTETGAMLPRAREHQPPTAGPGRQGLPYRGARPCPLSDFGLVIPRTVSISVWSRSPRKRGQEEIRFLPTCRDAGAQGQPSLSAVFTVAEAGWEQKTGPQHPLCLSC